MKNINIKFFQSLILIVIFSTTILSNTILQSIFLQNQLSNQEINNGFIKLRDNYDGLNGRMSIKDFFKQPDSYKKMKELYQDISNNNNLKYYEIATQRIEFIGEFTGDINQVVGGTESINKEINGDKITPLKSIQLGKTASEYLDFKNKINTGNYFEDSDFYLREDKLISVVLGDSYSEIYSIGDTFDVIYLGNIKLKCKVIGFLKKDSSFYLNEEFNLNDKIILPSLNVNSDKSFINKDFIPILYSIKNSGYIKYDSLNEYNTSISILNDIFNKVNIDWTYIGTDENPFKDNPINLSISTAKIINRIIWCIAFSLMILVYLLEKKLYNKVNLTKEKRSLLILQTKKTIFLSVQMFSIYIFSCFIIYEVLKNNPLSFLLIFIEKQLSIWILISIIFIVFMINKYIKKTINAE